MTLTTEFFIGPDWEDDVKQQAVDDLLDTIRSFAKQKHNCAFWDAKSAENKNCIVVYGFLGDLMNGMCIQSDDIEKTVSAWCNELADWCGGEESNDPCEWLSVELTDLEDAGGLHIECFDRRDERDHELYILPIREEA